MKKLLFSLFLICGLANASEVTSIREELTKEFIRCGESPQMTELINHMIKSGNQKSKSSSFYLFDFKNKVLGIPTKELMVGVCDESGEQSCGWGSARVYILDLPFKDAKSKLKNKYKIDFTIEKRDEEAEATERPVLLKLDEHSSSLSCDPGSL